MVNSPEDSGNERTSQGYKPATRKHVGWVDKTLSFFLSFFHFFGKSTVPPDPTLPSE